TRCRRAQSSGWERAISTLCSRRLCDFLWKDLGLEWPDQHHPLWEMSNEKELRRLVPAQGEFVEATMVQPGVFSPDGRLLASGTSTRDYTVRQRARKTSMTTGERVQAESDVRLP